MNPPPPTQPELPPAKPAPLRFGIFPLGTAGTPTGLATGAPDDPARIAAALDGLRAGGRPWLVRMYIVWSGTASTEHCLAELTRLAATPSEYDIALCYRDPAGDVGAWTAFLTEVVTRWGSRFAALQVTGEANLAGNPGSSDGDFPRVAEALTRGVIEAAAAKRDHGATAGIGFAVSFDPQPAASPLWPQVRRLGGGEFSAALDYAGLDMYPDVFGPPMPPERLVRVVPLILAAFREQVLEPIGIGAGVPLHICENGWPTGSRRSAERQADVLETIVRSLHAARAEHNVTHWELFTLRDADSSVDDLFFQFGILRDDYTPKPAFARLAALYRELG